ncbi:MAG: acetyltransferase, partial [Gammaproteobacteria bacterium]|nr:acetyltransferase [Gammaproteobacteria bacterium]
MEQLKLLGTCINYNGYGSKLEDLIYTPEELYRLISSYPDPFDFIREEPGYTRLVDGYHSDLEQANAIASSYQNDGHALYIL